MFPYRPNYSIKVYESESFMVFCIMSRGKVFSTNGLQFPILDENALELQHAFPLFDILLSSMFF